MALDKDARIKAQKEMLEQLFKENAELKEEIFYQKAQIDDLEKLQDIIQQDHILLTSSIQDAQEAKNRYESLINDIVKLKRKYEHTYCILDKLKKD